MQRRTFLGGAAAVAAMLATGCDPFAPVYTGESRTYGSYVLNRYQARPGSPNVVFVCLDDQNDWLGFLNPHAGTLTPNADALAASATVFDHAYCAAPMCLPSRTSMLYGKHPFETGVYDHRAASKDAYWTTVVDEFPTFIDDFWAAGYDTFGAGKIFGNGGLNRWTEYRRTMHYATALARKDPAWAGRFDPNWLSPYDDLPIGDGTGWPAAAIDFGPSGLTAPEDPDGLATDWARQILTRDHQRPFFLGLGIILPHTPWRLPQEFLDQHPLSEIQLPPFLPTDLDDLAPYTLANIVDTHGTYAYTAGQGKWAEAVQAYQAATSYCDWCLGQILDELAASPYADNTIVVLWSDHGFHLGEKLHFRKFTLWEPATHIPLVMKLPGQVDQARVPECVSLVDIGPTIAAAAQVPMNAPTAGTNLFTKGLDPSIALEDPPVMTWLEGNHAVRRENWRYIRYSSGDIELYDLDADPDEWSNLAGRPENATVIAELDAFLPPVPAAGARLEPVQPDRASMLSDPYEETTP